MNTSGRLICSVCQNQISKYTCPRCNLRSCSLNCYKAHSNRCTETFMRDNVISELQQIHANDETKKKMFGVLKRLHQEEEIQDVDEEESPISMDTIQKISSGEPLSVYDLSQKEKWYFQRAVASGELSKLIKPWDPWWMKPSAREIRLGKEGCPLVQPVDPRDVPEVSFSSHMPTSLDASRSTIRPEKQGANCAHHPDLHEVEALPPPEPPTILSEISSHSVLLNSDKSEPSKVVDSSPECSSLRDWEIDVNRPSGIPRGPEAPIPPLRNLVSTEPSPFLTFHLIDIIYSYCFTMRLYNGDWRSDAIGSAAVLLTVSSVLSHAIQPESVHEALSFNLEQTCSPSYKHVGGLQFGMILMDDLIKVLSLGSAALICLLCDVQRLVREGEMGLRKEKQQVPCGRKKLKLAYRKACFMMSWVHEQPDDIWLTLSTLVLVEKESILQFHENHRSILKDKKNMEPGVLVL